MPQVSSQIPGSTAMFTSVQLLKSLESFFIRNKLEKSVFIAHSYGTVILSWIINNSAKLVKTSYFIDPVCFHLHDASVCYNFVFRQPRNIVQFGIWYLASREIGISYALCRHFWWYENLLLAQNVPKDSKIWIAQSDEIINAHGLETYLSHHEIDYTMSQSHHGAIVLDRSCWNDIFAWLNNKPVE
jgi:hypothetical protein